MPLSQPNSLADLSVMTQVLDAPQLTDDFYLNLVDWSSQNVLAVGLGACVYLWSACTSKVTKLCEFGGESQNTVCSVSWSQRGTYLSVGTNNGEVQIWDVAKCKLWVPPPTPSSQSYRPLDLRPCIRNDSRSVTNQVLCCSVSAIALAFTLLDIGFSLSY